MIPDDAPPTSLDKPPPHGKDKAMSARVARQEATVEEVLRRLDCMQHSIEEYRRESNARFETQRKESEERFETLRKESEGHFETLRKASEEHFETLRKESEGHFETVHQEGEARFDALRKESDAKFQFLMAQLLSTNHLVARIIGGLAAALVGILAIALLR
jgi:predicted  nucleic acid-binding Zn-ribbon protein